MRSKSFLRVVFHRVIKSANGLPDSSPVLLRAAACSCFSFILIIIFSYLSQEGKKERNEGK